MAYATLGASFLEGNFHPPALEETVENKSRRGMQIGAQQGPGIELFQRIANQDPAQGGMTGTPE